MAYDTLAVHDTEHYKVVVGTDGTEHDTQCYHVVNKKTGVTEAIEKLLPQAILHAENSNSFMVNRLWRWVAANGAQQGDALDKDAAVAAFDLGNLN